MSSESGLETIVRRFEAAWLRGQRPDLDAVLSGLTGTDRTAALVELVHAELELRLKAGEPARVEDYLRRYPELSGKTTVVKSLIEAEYRQRLREKPVLPLQEYQIRFPELWSELETPLGLLRASATPPDPSTPMDLPPLAPAASPASASGAAHPDLLPGGTRYRPLRLHARGGLGEVLLAHDAELHREVALKRMQRHCAEDADSRRRFLLEAEVTARLEHPGIVPVHGLVLDESGQPCYAMRFIEGPSLKQALDAFHQADKPGRDPGERALALRKLLGDFVAVCRAVGYAHSRGVVHRDLKPQNVMLGRYGEVLVVDWGLAKMIERTQTELSNGEDSLQATRGKGEGEGTRQGAALGTPAYMSPEQAAGRWDILRPASDIYALGATLYAVLTGRAPVQGGNVLEIMEKVKRGEFPAPRQVKKEVPHPLEAVCLKAMALQPLDRYETALDLADDVERWLADEPVTAYREPWRVRAGRWVRRHRTLVTGVAVALFLLALGGVAAGFWYQQQEAEHQRQRYETEKGIEVAASEAATLLDRGLKEVDNPPAWQTTLAAARTALRQAEALIAREPQLREGELDQRVGELIARLDADEKDHRLITTIEKVHFKLYEFRSGYTPRQAYEEIREALAQWGLPVAGMPADRVAALVQRRPRPMQERLLGLLYWMPAVEKRQAQWLIEVMEVTDRDPWRQQVRQAIAQNDARLLAQLFDQGNVAQQPPPLLVEVAKAPQLGNHPSRIRLLRRAQQQYPGDFWVNFELAATLFLSVFPEKQGTRPARAEELALLSEVAAFDRVAVGLRPDCAPAHINLGNTLRAQGDLPGAMACFKKALQLDPTLAMAHLNLGYVLRAQGDLQGAIICYTRAIDLDPTYGPSHYNLGNALKERKDLEGAIACYRKAINLDPTYLPAHVQLGSALWEAGNLTGAIARYRKALDLNPKDTITHYNLGNALKAQGDLPGAIACYHKVLKLAPNYAEAHCNLGFALQAQGHFAQALEALKRGHQLGSRRPGWPYPSARWVEDCQRLLDLDARLPALLKGEDHPKDTAEQLALADLCRLKKRYAVAAHFYADACAAGAALTTTRAYDAACAAVLAANGQGDDAGKLGPNECSRLRQQGLDWLRETLKKQTQPLENADAGPRAALRKDLQHWQQDVDLASVRDAKALAGLPEAQRAPWQQLWSDVESLLQKCQDRK
jgi:tetratricopeptide (TPR) repeat protein/tRNA A-37 threonylcarbamoyl transferase component Bud32